jgi:RNA polymerase sigma factor (sigma-70 family)
MKQGGVSTAALEERRDRLAELLAAAQALQPGALDRIVAELSPMLWQVARAQRLDPASCEDVLQTTWLSLLRGLGEIRSPAALVAWLITTTKREAWRVRDLDRRRRPLPDTSLANLPDPDGAPDEQLLHRERDRALWRAVGQLPRRCQELLRIVAFVHRPHYDSVASALGMPRGAIGPNRGRCLGKLRELLLACPDWTW